MSRRSSTHKTTVSLESCGWEMSNRYRRCDPDVRGDHVTAGVVAQHVAYGNLDHAFAGTPATCGCARTDGTGSQPLNNREQVHCLVRHHCSLRALSDVLVTPHGIVPTRRCLFLRRALHGSRKASEPWTVTYPEALPKRSVVSESSVSVGAVPREPCGNHHRLR